MRERGNRTSYLFHDGNQYRFSFPLTQFPTPSFPSFAPSLPTDHAFFGFGALSLDVVPFAQLGTLVAFAASRVAVEYQPLQVHDHGLSARGTRARGKENEEGDFMKPIQNIKIRRLARIANARDVTICPLGEASN